MRHPGTVAWYAGTLALLGVVGAATPGRAGQAVGAIQPVFFAPGLPAHRPHRLACEGGPLCAPGGPIYYYPTYAPAPPVLLYPTYGPPPPGYYYPVYGPPPPAGRVAPCHAGPPPCLAEPPLAAPVP